MNKLPLYGKCVLCISPVCAMLPFSVGASTLSLVYVSHTFVKTFHRETNFHFGAVCCHNFPTHSDKLQSFFLSLSDELGRVRLRFGPKPGSDYINASFIDVRTTEHHSTLYTGSHE